MRFVRSRFCVSVKNHEFCNRAEMEKFSSDFVIRRDIEIHGKCCYAICYMATNNINLHGSISLSALYQKFKGKMECGEYFVVYITPSSKTILLPNAKMWNLVPSQQLRDQISNKNTHIFTNLKA